MIYRSKKDGWLVVIIAIVVVIVVSQFVWGIYNLLSPNGNAQVGWIMVLISTVTGAVLLGLTYPLYYQISSSDLSVRSGFLRWQIPLASIEEVRPTSNPLGSPALSLDRLRVEYRRGGRTRFILVSPEDKAGFMGELAASEAGLEIRDGRIIRVV